MSHGPAFAFCVLECKKVTNNERDTPGLLTLANRAPPVQECFPTAMRRGNTSNPGVQEASGAALGRPKREHPRHFGLILALRRHHCHNSALICFVLDVSRASNQPPCSCVSSLSILPPGPRGMLTKPKLCHLILCRKPFGNSPWPPGQGPASQLGIRGLPVSSLLSTTGLLLSPRPPCSPAHT